MCGIFGFIGRSKNQRVSYEFAHALFVKTEKRGEHASGFWACEKNDGRVCYDKEPIKSSIYVTRPIWSQDFADVDSDVLLGHCRFSTTTAGDEKFNKNNHPHVSADYHMALIHNGKIPEYHTLKHRYDCFSECDSEILLRMIESQENATQEEITKEWPEDAAPWAAKMPIERARRLLGIKEVFARVTNGAMAVAFGERMPDGSRYLWLFRDKERPIHVVDLRKTLGQIVFCSTAEVWRDALSAYPAINPWLLPSQNIIEVPEDEIWMMLMRPDDTWLVKKYRVTKVKLYEYDREEDTDAKVARNRNVKACSKIIGRLGIAEEIIEQKPTMAVKVTEKKRTKITKITENGLTGRVDHIGLSGNNDSSESTITPPDRGIDMAEFNSLVTNIKQAVADIEIIVHNDSKEDSVATREFEMVVQSLADAYGELAATICLLKNGRAGGP